MAFKVGVGKFDFEDLRKAQNYYVDKTEIIHELVNNTDNLVTLFTRPRRFGKTLTMSMLENFFNIQKDSREIFEGLDITKHEKFCEEWMNQYPVLFISLKDVEALNFESAYRMFETVISDVCKKIANLFQDAEINAYDLEVFEKLQSKTANEDEIKNSLKLLMRMMYVVYEKRVILLIDEYDVPLAKASEVKEGRINYYPQMLDVIRGMMSTALKDNEYLKFAVITGCLRIAKESIFTGTNNFAAYSVLDDRFSQYFGFSPEEVSELLKAAEREESASTVKKWYDGYIFGNSYVYCPWDVINYVSALRYDKNSRPKNYWKNTSGNDIIKTFVAIPDFDVSERFETLMNGGSICQTISDELTYDKLNQSEENLWSVLLMTGYITKADARKDTSSGELVELKIPNEEIASIFEDKVVDFFRETLDSNVHKSLMDALWEGDEETAGELITDLLWETISYHNYHENYYHAFLTGLFVGHGYEVKSDQDTAGAPWRNGLGRTDIVIRNKKNRRAVIIEAKKADDEAHMEEACLEGKEQIIRKQYIQGLKGYRKIMCYGVGFFEKTALVRRLEM